MGAKGLWMPLVDPDWSSFGQHPTPNGLCGHYVHFEGVWQATLKIRKLHQKIEEFCWGE